MRHGISWIRRAGVAALVLVSLCTGTVALPHAGGSDDLGCRPILVDHDESAHYFAAPSASPQREAEHCFLCHALRSFHPAFEKYHQQDDVVRAEHLHAASVSFADRLDWALAPGRAPPA